jgi:hypothetical protein
MAWNDENAGFDCGVEGDVELSPCAAAAASVASGWIAGPSSVADPAILIKCKVKQHQFLNGARYRVDQYRRCVVCWRGGRAESREKATLEKPGSLIREGEQESRGRSLNAAELRMRRTHIMCMRRQRCGVMSDSKGGTRRPKLASSSSSVIWW